MPVDCSCRKVKPGEWHDKQVNFDDRAFYTKRLPLFFHMPIGLEKRISQLKQEITMKGYAICDPFTVIQKDGSLSGQVMIEIEKPRFFDPKIETLDNKTFYGYVSEESPFNLCSALSEAKHKCKLLGKKTLDIYFWYTTCPQCRRVNGNQTVILIETV